MNLTQFKTSYFYFSDETLRRDFLNNFFTPILRQAVDGDEQNFLATFHFLRSIPEELNPWGKWNKVFENFTFAHAPCSLLKIYIDNQKHFSLPQFRALCEHLNESNFDYFLELIEDRPDFYYFFKTRVDFYTDARRIGYILDHETIEQSVKNEFFFLWLDYICENENSFHFGQLLNFLDYQKRSIDDNELRFADPDYSLLIKEKISEYFNTKNLKALCFLATQDEKMENILVFNADDLALSIINNEFLHSEDFEFLHAASAQVLFSNPDGLLNLLYSFKEYDIVFLEQDYVLCTHLAEIFKHHQPELLNKLAHLFEQSMSNNIHNIITRKMIQDGVNQKHLQKEKLY